MLAEVAEGPVLLPPLAPVALHREVARPLHDRQVVLRPQLPDLFLACFHLVVLFTLAGFLFRHFQMDDELISQQE